MRTHLTKLDRAQQNLIVQLEVYQPTGDDEIDTDWRTSLQRRFAVISTERRQAAARIADSELNLQPRSGRPSPRICGLHGWPPPPAAPRSGRCGDRSCHPKVAGQTCICRCGAGENQGNPVRKLRTIVRVLAPKEP